MVLNGNHKKKTLEEIAKVCTDFLNENDCEGIMVIIRDDNARGVEMQCTARARAGDALLALEHLSYYVRQEVCKLPE